MVNIFKLIFIWYICHKDPIRKRQVESKNNKYDVNYNNRFMKLERVHKELVQYIFLASFASLFLNLSFYIMVKAEGQRE